MVHVSIQLYLIVFKQIRILALWGLFQLEHTFNTVYDVYLHGRDGTATGKQLNDTEQHIG